MTGRFVHPHTAAWAEAIAGFDAFVFVTPEYNRSIPGALKNAIDFLYYEWNDKAAGFVSYGVDAGGARAVEHLRVVMGELRVADVRTQVALSLHNDFEALHDVRAGRDPRRARPTRCSTRSSRGGARCARCACRRELSRELWRVALIVALGAMISQIDTSVVNVGLERIGRDLDSGLADVQWVANAYLIALAAALPACGWLVRRFGSGTRLAVVADRVHRGLRACARSPVAGLAGRVPRAAGRVRGPAAARRADRARAGGRAGAARAGDGDARHGGDARADARAGAGRRDRRDRVLAVAVRGQPADRRARDRARLPLRAARLRRRRGRRWTGAGWRW